MHRAYAKISNNDNNQGNKMTKKKKILISIATVVLVLAVAAASYMIFFRAEDPYVVTVNDFVKYSAEGNYEDAYIQLAMQTQDIFEPTDFEAQISALELDESCKLGSYELEDTPNEETEAQKTLTGEIVCDSKKFANSVFVLDGDAVIISYSISE
jgi:hypothetical protein